MQDPASHDLRSRNFTRVEFDRMIDANIFGEDEHIELVNGRIVQMSPEGPSHAGTVDLSVASLSPDRSLAPLAAPAASISIAALLP